MSVFTIFLVTLKNFVFVETTEYLNTKLQNDEQESRFTSVLRVIFPFEDNCISLALYGVVP